MIQTLRKSDETSIRIISPNLLFAGKMAQTETGKTHAAVLISQTPDKSKVLLTKRALINYEKRTIMNYAGHFVFPGGISKPAEHPQETAQREFYEETGYRGIIKPSYFTTVENNDFVISAYLATVNPHESFNKNNEVEKMIWLTPEDALRYLNSKFYTLQIAKEYLANHIDRKVEKPIATIRLLEKIIKQN